MHYITLDLEWNQAYAEKALAVQKRLNLRLRGEVIQIGAVKLDANMNICGSYQVIVKPKFFKRLHRHVSKLTGISQEQIDMGTGIEIAAERFKKWCGNDFAFLTCISKFLNQTFILKHSFRKLRCSEIRNLFSTYSTDCIT
jgi:DNA polymerase III alpha subunit (gram-positive type)